MSHIPISLEVRFVALPIRWSMRDGVLVWEKTGRKPSPGNPRELLDLFQRMKQSETAGLEFLNEVGAWQITEVPAVRYEQRKDFIECFTGHRHILGLVKRITFEELWQEQEYWRDLLNPRNIAKRRLEFAPPSKQTPEMSALQSQFFNTLPLHLEWVERPRGVIQAVTGRELIQGLIWTDIITGAKFQVCQNPDCPRKNFTSYRIRTFCSEQCAHLMASRAYQAREREKRRKRRKLDRSRKKSLR